MTPVFVIGIIFGTFYGIVNLAIRRKDRLSAMERGLDPTMFDSKTNFFNPLKIGLLLVGIGSGIFIGNILTATTRLDPEVVYFGLICIGGGVGLLVSFFMEKKKENAKETKPETETKTETINEVENQ